MATIFRSCLFLLGLLTVLLGRGQRPTEYNIPDVISVRAAGPHSVRVTFRYRTEHRPARDLPFSPALAERSDTGAVLWLAQQDSWGKKKVGNLIVEVGPYPHTVRVTTPEGRLVQELVFRDSSLTFLLGDAPVLGLGEGGHRPDRGVDWRKAPIEYDRRGRLQEMQPRWQSDAYGSRNPVPLLVGTDGWALFIASPWGQIDLRDSHHGVFIPWKPAAGDSVQQDQKNQGLAGAKGLPPASSVVPGEYDVFIFDAHDPSLFMADLSRLTGPAVMPPKWALGYMQSHRTLKDEAQMLGIVDSFRARRIPVDAVIYLGTGFTPRGWNTTQPSFDFNPEVFHRDPAVVLADLHAQHVRVVLHMVPWDRDKLPSLHGTIPAVAGEVLDDGHIQNYWQQHVALMKTGADAFWPDEGDWFNLYERIKRHQLYYQGPLSTFPNVRPWSLHRNGYLGIARWGGWIWSGDTESSWKTLEGQVAVGINSSLSVSPYWGSDIGGFYPNSEKTGELYARWFQFGAFCPSFRSHGRTTMTILPWGWGQGDRGELETSTNSKSLSDSEIVRRNVLVSEMNNPLIEPVVKKYDELRYQLLPYNYTLAYEARHSGMPFMRALWLHYPDDTIARGLGSEYLWGRDMLIAPVFEKGATRRIVYLPKGVWYDWWTGIPHPGGQWITRDVDLSIIPIYVRAGAILPVDPVRQYTGEVVKEPTTLRVYPGANGDLTLYDDDGISLDYLRGSAVWIRCVWDDKHKLLRLSGKSIQREFRVRLMTTGAEKTVLYKGNDMRVQF